MKKINVVLGVLAVAMVGLLASCKTGAEEVVFAISQSYAYATPFPAQFLRRTYLDLQALLLRLR